MRSVPMTCILIDDDPEDQEIFLFALKQLDRPIHCEVVDDGIEGLNKLRITSAVLPDFVFIDVNMHMMDGLEVLTEIRKLKFLDEVTVIMFSTSADFNMKEKSKLMGANDFLVKPAQLDLLAANLAEILHANRA